MTQPEPLMGLNGMPQGVPIVQGLPANGFALGGALCQIGGHDRRLHSDGTADEFRKGLRRGVLGSCEIGVNQLQDPRI